MAGSFTPQRILVIRLSSLGDVLLTTPLVRALKRRFPQCELDYLVSSRYRELLVSNPYVNRVLALEPGTGISRTRSMVTQIRESGYDVAIDLHGSIRSLLIRAGSRISKVFTFRKHRLARTMLIILKRSVYPDDRSMAQWMLDSGSWLGVEDDGDGLDFFVDPSVESEVQGTIDDLASNHQQKWIAFAPGARHTTKRWFIDRWCDLAKRIVSHSQHRIMILGDKVDKPLGDEIINRIGDNGWNAAGQLSLSQSAAAVSHCQVLITHDSGLMHVAAARKVPVVAIFGPTVKAFGFYPFRVLYRVVERSLNCRPCSTKGSSRCPLGHFKCMQEITPEHVIGAFNDLIEGL